MRVDLALDGGQVLLDPSHDAGPGDEAQRQVAGAGEGDQRAGELGRVTALLAAHGLPRRDGLLRALGVVLDVQLGPDGRGPLDEQLGGKKPGSTAIVEMLPAALGRP